MGQDHHWEGERPIGKASQDRLERSEFVDRLIDALVNRTSRRSSGVVVGITGPWGSGKSSVLNLLHLRLKQTYPNSLVLRFDPWLVAGRDDLIGQFLTELLAAIRQRMREDQGDWRDLAQAILEYAEALTPLAKVANPTLGEVAAGLWSSLRRGLARQSGLVEVRERVRTALERVRAPVVILIDELDRVEDEEVRTVAQLVRAVADFPRISYVLAYDHHRVVQALGMSPGLSRRDRQERGHAYLEKIVQLAIPLPITFDDELRSLLLSELEPLIPEGLITSAQFADDRAREFVDELAGGVLRTPRDVKRAVGAFRVMRAMTAGEVDWLDLLGYCALQAVRPDLISLIRRNYDRLVDDPPEGEAMLRVMETRTARPSLVPPDVVGTPVGELFARLFPAAGKGDRDRPYYPDPLSSRRALLTVLRLGLRTGEMKRESVDDLIGGSSEVVADSLRHSLQTGVLADVLDRIDDIYADYAASVPIHFWLGVSKFLSPRSSDGDQAFLEKREAAHSLTITLAKPGARRAGLRQAARQIFVALANFDDRSLVPEILRRQFFAYGLHGVRNDGDRGAILTQDQTVEWTDKLLPKWKTLHLSGDLLSTVVDLHAFHALLDLNMWDEECKSKIQEELSEDRFFDRFTLMAFGATYFTEPETVERMVGLRFYRERVEARLAGLQIGTARPHLEHALRRALRGPY